MSVKTVRNPTPKRLRTSIRHDAVHPSDYLRYTIPSACEDCSHFNSEKETCTLDYNSEHHRRDYQKKCYELSGKMAICRFLEID
jgi:predicted HD phosphohydrolase